MSKPIIFNALDWSQEDYRYKDDDNNYTEKFIIRIFGRTEDGNSVSVRVDEYYPEFYVEIPNDWDEDDAKLLRNKLILMQTNKRLRIKSFDLVKRHKFYYFTAGQLYNFVRFEFTTLSAMKSFAKLVTNNRISINKDIPKQFVVYESNVDPYLRFMHINNLNASGWIKINKYSENQDDRVSTNYNIICYPSNVEKHDKDSIAPFKIASFDIECTSGDGSFPKPERKLDQVIQIGTVITVNGVIIKKHIITLGSCDPIEGVVVEPCDNEIDLLLAWSKFLMKEDPDVITGYNIFGFDEKYLYERWLAIKYNFDIIVFNYFKLDTDKDLNAYYNENSEHLKSKGIQRYNRWDIINQKKMLCEYFANLSRLLDKTSNFKTMMLQSSGLGDNFLNYFEMEGRLQIDLMKELQRDEKLTSWKLDSVAEHFMKKEVENIENITNNKYGVIIKKKLATEINVGNYIKIDENGDIIDNKLLIESIDEIELSIKGENISCYKLICINNNIDYELQFTDKVKYGMVVVKDDITANDIFRLQKGTSKDRQIIATYCIQDCVLVSTLFDKLLILIKNMSMSNVCSVPLSYIFVRGQGIKSLSLVSKVCREKNYLIPVVTKDNPFLVHLLNDDDILKSELNEKSKYEGAIVFDPEIGFHPYPISVMDYNSLYPSSMIDINISHEMLVHKYLQTSIPEELLKNYTFKDVEFMVNGNKKICTFARNNDGSLGILPTILQDLLAHRKIYKKKKDSVTDKLLQNIYDGLQLAFKVTANSLYGQLGADTSPISLKDCAASTTARGRYMLSYAKDYTENNFRDLLETINITGEINFEIDGKQEIIEVVKEIYKEHDISPKYKIEKIERIVLGKEVEIHELKFKEHYRIYTKSPPCIKKGIKILLKRSDNNKFIFTAYTVTSVNNDNIVIGLTSDKVPNKINEIGNKWMFAMVVYGDTDSIFIRMNMINRLTGLFATDKKALSWSIKLGEIASKMLKRRLPFPHNMEYEKTFYPWVIVSKKKYVGNKYGDNPDKFKPSDSMGMVLKRRDIPFITKKIVREVLNIIMTTNDVPTILNFTKQFLKDLFNNKFPSYYFEISQTLKDSYSIKDDELDVHGMIIRDDKNKKVTRTSKVSMKNIIDVFSSDIHDERYETTKEDFEKIKKAHIRLVGRMTERDPGNKPQLNDRIPYIFIETYNDKATRKKMLQGDMIETPTYIREKKLKIDFLHYLTNHIKTPTLQILSKVSEDAVQIFENKIYIETKKLEERTRLIMNKKEIEMINEKVLDSKSWFNKKSNVLGFLVDNDNINDDARSLISKYKEIKI